MYKFAICDDEAADLVYVRTIIEQWGKARKSGTEIKTYPSAESFLFAYEEEKDFDVLLLDIEMGKMSGVELAREIRSGNRSIQIIFVTGYMEYISEGYDVEALHYLLKPVTREKLWEVIDRAAERIQVQERVLLLETSGETLRIPLYEIKWLEVQKNYVTIHGAEDYSIKRPLKEMIRELDERFFQIHRSYIVNLACVKKITKNEVVLKSGMSLPLSRGLYDKINQALIRYF